MGAGTDNSFVMADIPGLIQGAAEGSGLGVQFLRHLARTRILLHLVEVAPLDGSDPIDNARLIEAELADYSQALRERPVWLVLSKTDLVTDADLEGLERRFADAFPGRPLFAVSAVTTAGIGRLTDALLAAVAGIRERLAGDEEYAEREAELQARIGEDVLRGAVLAKPGALRGNSEERDEADDDGEDQVQVTYVPE